MAVATQTGLVVRSIEEPDERREPAGARVDVINLGGTMIGHAYFHAGWRWSESVKPIAGTDSCQVAHTGFVASGRLVVRMDDGTERELHAGDAVIIPPGHDAWVVGDETVEMIEFAQEAVKTYATPAQR